MHMLEHFHGLLEQKILAEQAQVEDLTNTAQAQGKSQCIPPIFLDFGFAK
jgi:hypothetical protein